MKSRFWMAVSLAIPLVALAAEEAPPQEVLENLEFFQNYDLVKDPQFMAQADRDIPEAIMQSTAPVSGKGPSDANL